jgi:hypothetical protein
VTCHPRLGGASQREAGVTGIFCRLAYDLDLLLYIIFEEIVIV